MGAPGFDDAPMFRLQQSSAARNITFVYPYYENAHFLLRQLDRWNNYDETLRQHLGVIVVDDGSPTKPIDAVLRDETWRFQLRVFRIEVDIRWNWLAARNIGMRYARGWCLLTDMDHVVPEETLRAVIFASNLTDTAIYRFCRREASGLSIHPHPNSMLMTQQTFWHVGGYDEELSGHYGTDGDWRRRCAAAARVHTLPCQLERHEFCEDSSTTRYLRKQPVDAGKKAIIAKRGKGWRPRVLSFPYHEVPLP
jgi:hypothetical protein